MYKALFRPRTQILFLTALVITTLSCRLTNSDSALADGDVSSGGVAPSSFEVDRTTLIRILSDREVGRELGAGSVQAGGESIRSITPVESDEAIVWRIVTYNCTLDVGVDIDVRVVMGRQQVSYNIAPINSCEGQGGDEE